MFGKHLLFPRLFIVAVVIIHVIAKPIDDGSKKLTLDTPKEILNSASIRVPTRWEKGVVIKLIFMYLYACMY